MTNQTKGYEMPRVLFEASNLRVGGGVQVAASLVDEFHAIAASSDVREQYPWLADMTYRISPEVYANLASIPDSHRTRILETKWYHPGIWLGQGDHSFDLQFTVFGPRYGRRYAPITVTGIADGTSIYAWPEGVPRGTLKQRLRRGVRGKISRALFKRESFLISESGSLMQAFHKRSGYRLDRTAIVPNVVNAAVSDRSINQPIGVDLRSKIDDDVVLFSYAARMYAHKNHKFLPLLRQELLRNDVDAKFVLTLSDSEWASASEELRSSSINVGPLSIHQVADLNSQCDAVIFPSLLESYSVTPLEALVTNGLLFASDRPFVRDVVQDAACYFDPMNPTSAAKSIAQVLHEQSALSELRTAASELVQTLQTSRTRATTYLKIIDALVSERT